jgi:hypothetical protein
MSRNTGNRLVAMEKALSAKPSIPRTLCKMRNGTIIEIRGMSVLTPFLNDEIIEAVCDDADVACLLRSMDSENKVTIETYMIVNGKPVRQYI